MMLDYLETIEELRRELDTIEKRNELLEEILFFYNSETMVFDIPEKWEPDGVGEEIKSPRHHINHKIAVLLSYTEKKNINFRHHSNFKSK